MLVLMGNKIVAFIKGPIVTSLFGLSGAKNCYFIAINLPDIIGTFLDPAVISVRFQMRQRARKYVVEHFDARKHVARTEEIMLDFLKKRK